MNSCSSWTYPSDNDLFYTHQENINGKNVTLLEDEHHHLNRVMKYRVGEMLFVTDGNGYVHHVCIEAIGKTESRARILNTFYEEQRFPNITFYLPVLKNSDRLEFAVEKLVELGFASICFYKADKAVKQSISIPRMEKIALHALKQSLHAHKAKIELTQSLKNLTGVKKFLLFSQEAPVSISDYRFNGGKEYAFVIGPEGGFSERELALFETSDIVTLTMQRLRSETAIIYAASLLTKLI